MATLAEINVIMTDTDPTAQALREKVRNACFIAAQIIISNNDTGAPWDATNHTQRQKWADKMLASPDTVARQMFYIVVAANESATQTQILNASDAAIKTNVNASIDSLSTNIP